MALFFGFVVWFGSYLAIQFTSDASGFVFVVFAMMLVGDLIGGGILYGLWRLFGSTPPDSLDQGGHRTTPADVEQ